jgi:DNA-binding beta-propeller fold protein YncE
LNSTATTVLNATYLGGSGQDFLTGIALDPDGGSLYVTGVTFSNDFPTKNPLQGSLGASGQNAFVTKLDSSLSTLMYSTYLGQDSDSYSSNGFRTIAVDSSSKNAYVIGTAGPGFPITSGAFQTTCSSLCAFLTKLNPSGSSLLYSTYLGEQSRASSIAVDSLQNSTLAVQRLRALRQR